jgi:hypothetical protein
MSSSDVLYPVGRCVATCSPPHVLPTLLYSSADTFLLLPIIHDTVPTTQQATWLVICGTPSFLVVEQLPGTTFVVSAYRVSERLSSLYVSRSGQILCDRKRQTRPLRSPN